MKTNKLFSIILAGVLAATAVVSASAQTLEGTLADSERTADTEVKAKIEAAQPGDVSYIITIPDSVDFGTLHQPETYSDSNKYVSCDITATEIKNFNNKQFVEVHVKDTDSEDEKFYITQKDTEEPFKINYDVYEREVTEENIDQYSPVTDSAPGTYGYHICSFGNGSESTSQRMTLVLNQKAIYDKNLNDIAGDYSGTMVFHSKIITLGE